MTDTDDSADTVPTPDLEQEELPLEGLAHGIRAVVRYPPGRRRVDRSGRLKYPHVLLTAVDPPNGTDPPAGFPHEELAWLLKHRRRSWKSVTERWGEHAADRADTLVRCGVVEAKAEADREFMIVGVKTSLHLTSAWAASAGKRRLELLRRTDPAQTRSELLRLMEGVSQLQHERELLAAHGRATVPPGSATRAGAWETYEFVLRVAHWWWTDPHRRPRPIPDETLSISHGHRKGTHEVWTSARVHAFENLMKRAISDLLDFPDHEIRVRGPLRWFNGETAIDASRTPPWSGLPSRGVHMVGRLERADADGVFVIENVGTFYRVCQDPEITRTWICVWGAGYARTGLVELLQRLSPLPIAVWGDLDAHGIEIITNLRERVGRAVYPVAMTAEAWRAGPHRSRSQERRRADAGKARILAAKAPEELRHVAELIATEPDLAGLGLEQQVQHGDVFPVLSELLAGVLASARHGTSGA
ncbi:Wadjet anti-phage system protein JetD domain-containing protein [Nocardiopsis aegyptia]|uniref:Wadjet protein JetD C-terminal domain-containing protein n=1 Tax=Nocardiopsis aegyptia TaxID=220378 RepID=A0A7Z0J8J1_9ACTN|nr:Wadjet anti-phage system protein JetD domain-containing protein [Nocardiopsis aegyptia]NYJ33046.1 hypothetical protein [Nocardiopsis aegyptia]